MKPHRPIIVPPSGYPFPWTNYYPMTTKPVPSLDPPKRKAVLFWFVLAVMLWMFGAICPFGVAIIYSIINADRTIHGFPAALTGLCLLIVCAASGIASMCHSQDNATYNRDNNL